MATQDSVDLVSAVRRVIADRIAGLVMALEGAGQVVQLMHGKMLRTALAARLAGCGLVAVERESVARLCAAIEMAHTASLCHDDVIDGAIVRRGHPALWRATSPSASVLIGDLLLCAALDLLVHTESGRYVGSFVSKVREVCAAETEQELQWRGKPLDERTCLRLARGKTGPLFAFVARVCGGDDPALSSALEEAGYRIGTAYQLADDLLDLVGREEAAGKTLGTDLERGKFTLPQASEEGHRIVREHIASLCSSALECVGPWAEARRAVAQFLGCDLEPVLAPHLRHLDVGVGSGT